MAKKIKITAGAISLEAELLENKTAQAIWEALPLEAAANRWGDEIYFSIPVKMGSEAGREVVEVGDLGYWPPGQAFCLFFGPTPASAGQEPRAASPVNVFGRCLGDATRLRQTPSGARVRIERLEAES